MAKTDKCFLLIFLLIPVFLHSRSIESENFLLEINEESGIFRFASTAGGGDDLYLFSDKLPETTNISIFEDDGFYLTGDSSHFELSFTGDEFGGTLESLSEKLSVSQEVHFDDTGEILVEITIRNRSETPVSSGMKFLLDNIFEKEDRFSVSDNGKITKVNKEWEDGEVRQFESFTAGSIEFIPGDNKPAGLPNFR